MLAVEVVMPMAMTGNLVTIHSDNAKRLAKSLSLVERRVGNAVEVTQAHDAGVGHQYKSLRKYERKESGQGGRA